MTQSLFNNSGFPLQMALEKRVKNGNCPNWRVLYSEHKWLDEDGNIGGYIDLVLQFVPENILLVIECKNINGDWSFLVENDCKPDLDQHILTIQGGGSIPVRHVWKKTEYLHPATHNAAYCITKSGSTDTKQNKRPLEG